MNPDDSAVIWTLVAQLERQTCERWRKEFYPARELEEALASECKAVETTTQRRPAGYVSLTISVIGQRPAKNVIDYHTLQRTGGKLYRVLEKA